MASTCPRCAGPIADAPDLAGQTAACPFCGQLMVMPATAIRVAARQELMDPPMPLREYVEPQPQIVVVHAPSRPSQPRLRTGGWFSRSFASTFGVMLAVTLFVVGIPALICAGAIGIPAFNAAHRAHEKATQQMRERKLRGDEEQHDNEP